MFFYWWQVNAARRLKSVRLVTPDWLWTCAERWERVEESLFPVGGERAGSRHPPPHCASPPHPPPTPHSPSADRFIDTINPLMTFSVQDIADMDAEVRFFSRFLLCLMFNPHKQVHTCWWPSMHGSLSNSTNRLDKKFNIVSSLWFANGSSNLRLIDYAFQSNCLNNKKSN